MHENRYLPDIYLPELGIGAGTAIWGFRACALGHARCCCLIRGFENIFGPVDGGPVLGNMLDLARCLGNTGKRKIQLAMPGFAGITHDEASLLLAFSASQTFDPLLRDAHLSWLFAMPATAAAGAMVDNLASSFARHDLVINPPRDIAPEPVASAEFGRLTSVRTA